ncbi:MAG: NlpC/P60 family protein [Bacillota bacterium]
MKRLIILMWANRKIKLLFSPALAFVLLLFLPFAAGRAAAYTVKAGDTLYGIGLRYGVTVQALQEANGITGHLIYPGQEIVIPGDAETNRETGRETGRAGSSGTETPPGGQGQSETTSPGTPPPSPSGPESKPLEEPDQPQVSHTVQKGECPYTIANRYGISVEALMQANHLTSPLIYPGQILIIPPAAQAGNPAKVSAPRPATNDLPSRSTPASLAKKILNYAASFLGTRYVYGGSSPRGFDCSGFVQYVFQSAGFELPHNAAAQAGYGTPVEKNSLQPGDLVFFSYYGSKGINHVGIYAGSDQFIHASTKEGVKYSSLSQPYYRQNYRGARRLLCR